MNFKKFECSTKFITNILFMVFMVTMSILILLVVQSRLTGREPSLFGHKMYVVDSGSMEPAIPINSLIIVRRVDPLNIMEGDVITFSIGLEKISVTHRVVEVVGHNQRFVTKGDANNLEDNSLVKGEEVIGKVVFRIPLLGYALRFLSSTPGIVFMLSMVVLSVVFPHVVRSYQKKDMRKE